MWWKKIWNLIFWNDSNLEKGMLYAEVQLGTYKYDSYDEELSML